MYERFIARQPILTHKLTLLGYELLFRASSNDRAPNDANATSHVISASTMLFGWERLVGPWLGFVNFGQAELLNGAALLLPHNHAVVELPADLRTSEEVIEACAGLQQAKYRVALDNFRDEEERRELLPFVDFLKVDFRETSEAEQQRLSEKYAHGSAALIATKVETWEELARARSLGFRNFQGYFFLRPRTLERRDLRGSQMNAVRLLQAVQTNPMNLNEIESIMKGEPALTVRLLRYLNSPVMARPAEITSIPMAVALLGEAEFRRWAALVAVVTPADGKPEELVRTALLRAFFCEEIGKLAGRHAPVFEYFLVGLLSVMNAILDQPIEEIVSEMAVSSRVRDALLGGTNELRKPLEAALAYERGDWETFSQIVERQAVGEERMPECYFAAESAARTLLAWDRA